MSTIDYTGLPFPVREGLVHSQRVAWEALSRPGTWMTGPKRVAVAAEVRHARVCEHCRRQKNALSPEAAGSHSSLGTLGANEVDLIHRIVSDPGRLSEAWCRQKLRGGTSEEEYIEILSIIAMVMMVDQFTFALGLPDHPLPEPQEGEPSRYVSPGARRKAAWLPITEPEDATPGDGELYPNPKVSYIHRALSSVPQSKRDYWHLASEHYLPGGAVYQFDADLRAISRPQMELIAARVSALHQCLY